MTSLEDKINNTSVNDRKLYRINRISYQITIKDKSLIPYVITFNKYGRWLLRYSEDYKKLAPKKSELKYICDGWYLVEKKGKLFSHLDCEITECGLNIKRMIKRGIPIGIIKDINIVYDVEFVDYHSVTTKELMRELKFDEYSQLVFDRENELTKIMMGEK